MKIFVGCSSSNNITDFYLEDARILLEQLFLDSHDLVFGACKSGIMGIAYNAAINNNRDIIGICPEIYKSDLEELNCTDSRITNNVNERTEAMIDVADVLLFLPGGIGTVYELMNAIESKRSKEHDKPIIIYNRSGFFMTLLEFLDEIYIEEFTSGSVANLYKICNTPEEVIAYINSLGVDGDIKKLGKVSK